VFVFITGLCGFDWLHCLQPMLHSLLLNSPRGSLLQAAFLGAIPPSLSVIINGFPL